MNLNVFRCLNGGIRVNLGFMNKINRGSILVALSCLSAVFAIYIGFFGLDKITMESLYNSHTYYFILFAVALWLQRGVSLLPDVATIKGFARRHYLPAIAALSLSIMAVIASPPDFRILADETNLLSMSMAMYDHHTCINPTQVLHYYHGMQRIVAQVTDMRPALFPFTISMVHSALGYHENNVFIVNAIAGCLSLFLLYYLVQIWFGRFWGSIAMLLLASYPLFVLYMTSAGFEVFNLLFALILFALVEKFLRCPLAESAELVLLILPLLAQTRYESALAVFCVVPLVLYCLPRFEYSRFSLRLMIWPLLFVPIAWLRVVTFSQQAFQVTEIGQAFGFDLFVKNVQKALPFFTGNERAYGMIPVITFLAVAGAVWIIFDLYARCKAFAKVGVVGSALPLSPVVAVSNSTTAGPVLIDAGLARNIFRTDLLMGILMLVFFVFHAVARFAYFWGDMTLQYTSRLGLIFLPALVFLAVYLLRRLAVAFQWSRSWALVGAVLLILHGWPVAGQNLAVRDILFYREFKSVREFLQQYFPARKDYIIVSELSNAYVPLRYNSISIDHLNANAVQVLQDLKNRTWRYLLVLQKIDTATGLPADNTQISSDFKLKTIYETQLSLNRILRISRFQP